MRFGRVVSLSCLIEELPIKQGLKLHEIWSSCFPELLIEELPIKQGLKLNPAVSAQVIVHPLIEELPIKQGLKLYCHCIAIHSASLIEELPIKQGLKHESQIIMFFDEILIEELPIKQGLKLKNDKTYTEVTKAHRGTSNKTRIETTY